MPLGFTARTLVSRSEKIGTKKRDVLRFGVASVGKRPSRYRRGAKKEAREGGSQVYQTIPYVSNSLGKTEGRKEIKESDDQRDRLRAEARDVVAKGAKVQGLKGRQRTFSGHYTGKDLPWKTRR